MTLRHHERQTYPECSPLMVMFKFCVDNNITLLKAGYGLSVEILFKRRIGHSRKNDTPMVQHMHQYVCLPKLQKRR